MLMVAIENAICGTALNILHNIFLTISSNRSIITDHMHDLHLRPDERTMQLKRKRVSRFEKLEVFPGRYDERFTS